MRTNNAAGGGAAQTPAAGEAEGQPLAITNPTSPPREEKEGAQLKERRPFCHLEGRPPLEEKWPGRMLWPDSATTACLPLTSLSLIPTSNTLFYTFTALYPCCHCLPLCLSISASPTCPHLYLPLISPLSPFSTVCSPATFTYSLLPLLTYSHYKLCTSTFSPLPVHAL